MDSLNRSIQFAKIMTEKVEIHQNVVRYNIVFSEVATPMLNSSVHKHSGKD